MGGCDSKYPSHRGVVLAYKVCRACCAPDSMQEYLDSAAEGLRVAQTLYGVYEHGPTVKQLIKLDRDAASRQIRREQGMPYITDRGRNYNVSPAWAAKRGRAAVARHVAAGALAESMAHASMSSRFMKRARTSRPGLIGDKEVKYVDVLVNVNPSTTLTGAQVLLNDVPQGTGIGDRLADRVFPSKIKGNFIVTSSVAATQDTTIRFLIVWDKNTNGAAPAWTDIINNTAPPVSDPVFGFHKMEYKRRFTVIFDKTIIMPLYNAGNPDCVQRLSFSKNLKKRGCMETQYTATGGGISDIESGSLYLISVSNQTSGTPLIYGETRFTYTG